MGVAAGGGGEGVGGEAAGGGLGEGRLDGAAGLRWYARAGGGRGGAAHACTLGSSSCTIKHRVLVRERISPGGITPYYKL